MGKLLSGPDFLVSGIDNIVSGEIISLGINVSSQVEASFDQHLRIEMVLASGWRYDKVLGLDISKAVIFANDYGYSLSFDVFVVEAVEPELSVNASSDVSLSIVTGQRLVASVLSGWVSSVSYSLEVVPPVGMALFPSAVCLNSFAVVTIPPVPLGLIITNSYLYSAELLVIGPREVALNSWVSIENSFNMETIGPIEPVLSSGSLVGPSFTLANRASKEVSVSVAMRCRPSITTSVSTVAVSLFMSQISFYHAALDFVAGVVVNVELSSISGYVPNLAVIEGDGPAPISVNSGLGYDSLLVGVPTAPLTITARNDYSSDLFAGFKLDLVLASISCYVPILGVIASFDYVDLWLNSTIDIMPVIGMNSLHFLEVLAPCLYSVEIITVKLLIIHVVLECSSIFNSRIMVFIPELSVYKWPNVKNYYF